ncbi:MAG: LLM class flavin-dependent oxidoreductase [Thaumarchaeota archaeon]|nr:LLM class flavin-dependent oxidoreductase [Nitrososphaerota archaeon]MDD9826504.1 LLM class flavin-dependent oxidoreductase [Nitrososphaerota archaeon]MDD9842413.1 LLM class flavin-dependent oxidoreductase [Nitrososphaerota archaeon]
MGLPRASCSLGSLLTVREVVSCARAAEAAGADTVWIPETWGMECFAMMGAVSQATGAPRIGSSIINVYSRSPALVAMGAVTADTLSSGRLILGLGASSEPIVRGLHGMAHGSPLSRVREYVEVVRLACSGGRIEHSGPHFGLSGFRLLVRPVRERIPVYLAAVGPAMVSLAAEVADGAILYLRPLRELREASARLRRHNASLDVAMQIVTAVSRDEEAAIARAKSTISFYVAVGSAYRGFLARNGYARETRDILDEYRRTGEARQPGLVPDAMARELAIFGDPEACRAQLARFARAGVTHPILQFNPVGGAEGSFGLLAEVIGGD